MGCPRANGFRKALLYLLEAVQFETVAFSLSRTGHVTQAADCQGVIETSFEDWYASLPKFPFLVV